MTVELSKAEMLRLDTLTDKLLQGHTSETEEMEWDALALKSVGILQEDIPAMDSQMDGTPEQNTEFFFSTYVQG